MPAKQKSRNKRPPAASKRKRVIHALYLAQPFLQFFALMAVLFVLGRCSPLASSSDHRRLDKISSSGLVSSSSDGAASRAEEEEIKRSSKELSETDELPIISQSDYTKLVAESLSSDKPADLPRVKSIFQQRARQAGGTLRGVRLLALVLSPEQRQMLLKDNSVRLNLAELMSGAMNPEVRRMLFNGLRKTTKLEAKAFLVFSDDTMQADGVPPALPIRLKFSYASPVDEKAYLQIKRLERSVDEAQQELIRSNMERSLGIAIVLE